MIVEIRAELIKSVDGSGGGVENKGERELECFLEVGEVLVCEREVIVDNEEELLWWVVGKDVNERVNDGDRVELEEGVEGR